MVVQAINTLLGDTSTYQAQLQQNIAKVIRSAQQNTADGIDEKLQELQKKLLKKANNKEAYDEVADEIFKLREQREKCTVPLLFPLCYIFPYKFTNSDKGKYKGTRGPVDLCSVPTGSQRPVDVGSEPTVVERRAAAETKKNL